MLVLLALGMAVGASADPAHSGCSASYTIGDHAPLWAPTGQWIVFDRHDVGCGMPAFLTFTRTDGGPATRLPLNGRQRVEWLPDGSAVLGNGLALVAPDGRTLRPSGPVPGSGAATHVSLSPDGAKIVFGDAFARHIYLAEVDGSSRRVLTSGAGESGPVWSPRGDLIAFGVAGGLDVVRPDGSGRRAVWRGTASSADFSWSPDGSMLAFLHRSDPRYIADALRVVDVDSGGGRDVLAGPFVEHAPSWRPGGGLIAVTRHLTHDASEIVTVRSDGTDQHVFGPGGELTWSPDGARVAYVWRGLCPATRLGVYVAAADGSDPRRLTNDCRIEGGPGPDVLHGTLDDDTLSGRDANDVLIDTYGEDVLNGGAGNDRLEGGEEADLLLGAGGNDLIRGGGGRDRIYGGPGRDRIEAGIAKDTIYVGDGQRDVVVCGAQFDVVVADRLDRIARDCEQVRVVRG